MRGELEALELQLEELVRAEIEVVEEAIVGERVSRGRTKLFPGNIVAAACKYKQKIRRCSGEQRQERGAGPRPALP